MFSVETICHALRDLVKFVQLKNHEKHHGGVVILVKLLAFSKEHSSMGVFHVF